MDQLTQIFSIPDPQKRIVQLTELARSLGINIAKAKNDRGEPDENKLAVLIFEGIREGRQKKRQKVMITVLAVVIFVLGTIAMYAVSHLVMSLSGPTRAPIFNEGE